MLLPLRYFLWAITRLFLSLRYRVRVQGLEQIRGLKGPVLVLPNHPGLVDPLLVLGAIWPALRPRPMVYEGNFTNPFMYLLMKLFHYHPQLPDQPRRLGVAPHCDWSYLTLL